MPQTLAPTFYIETIPVFGDLILAPMDGISDYPFRSICSELGSALSYTEFINAAEILAFPERILPKLKYSEAERPVVIQIYGEDPEELLKAALKVREHQPDIIDINMGCPSKSVANRGAGVGLMQTPLKVARIFRKLTKVLDIPITAKIRLGWDDESRTYPLISRIVEENGGALIALHARTKKQHHNDQADWEAIAEVKQIVSIPVIGNGGVQTVADIARIKAYTGCDGVMIGQAAMSNPLIFSRLDRDQVPREQVKQLMLTHLERNLDFYGPEQGLILFRKFASRYLAPYHLPRPLRQQLLTSERPDEFIAILDEVCPPT